MVRKPSTSGAEGLAQSGAGVKRGAQGVLEAGAVHLEDVERHHRRSLVETKMHCFKRLGRGSSRVDFGLCNKVRWLGRCRSGDGRFYSSLKILRKFPEITVPCAAHVLEENWLSHPIFMKGALTMVEEHESTSQTSAALQGC